jgi:hypothetical protein
MSYSNHHVFSWGYLFHLALLQSSAIYGWGNVQKAMFSFDETDLQTDFFSYAALSLVGYNRSSLLDVRTLTQVSQEVFSTFFQAFISRENGFNGHWAYERFDELVPGDLDFQPLVPITTTTTWTSYGDFCTSNATEGCFLTGQAIATGTSTITYSTYTGFNTSTATAVSISSTGFAISSTSAAATTIVSTQLVARAISSAVSPSAIPANVLIQAEILKLSPIAVWTSIAILTILALLTSFMFSQQKKHVKLLPRNVEAPASLLSFVYASTRLQAWAKQKSDDSEWDEHSGTGFRHLKRKKIGDRKQGLVDNDIDVSARMGSFGTNWGIEIDAIDQSAGPEEQTQ